MLRFLVICLAGAIGTGLRYLLGLAGGKLWGTAFPWATLIVNVAGSFLICLIMQVSLASDRISPTTRLALTTGLMGGLTTYSTFNYETLKFFREDAWVLGVANWLGTFLGCMLAGILGFLAARRLVGA